MPPNESKIVENGPDVSVPSSMSRPQKGIKISNSSQINEEVKLEVSKKCLIDYESAKWDETEQMLWLIWPKISLLGRPLYFYLFIIIILRLSVNIIWIFFNLNSNGKCCF